MSQSAPDDGSVAHPPTPQLQSVVQLRNEGYFHDLELTPADYQALLDEIAQAQAQDRDRLSRIHALEQALDQALICLDELRQQLHDQTILETQLATTEEFAYVQQQAIARLKLQLVEQRQALEEKSLETQQRDQALQELLATIEALTEAQQQELERLRSRLSHDQLEAQTHRSRLTQQLHEAQSVIEARQQRIAELETESLEARSHQTSLNEQLDAAQQHIQELSTRLHHPRLQLPDPSDGMKPAKWRQKDGGSAQPIGAIADLQQDLSQAHRTIADHVSQLAQHTVYQTLWQQQQQELEGDRDRLLARTAELEQQMADLQEQVLQQAQHLTEQETAVQYWKDRYTTSQSQMTLLKEQIEIALAQSPAEAGAIAALLSDLFAALQHATLADYPAPLPLPTLPLPRVSTVDLPEFLVRHRSSRSQRKRE